MQINHRHAWNITPQEAIALQKTMAAEVIHDRPLDISRVKLVAGVDVSVKDNVSRAAVVVLTFPGLEIIETALAEQPTPFPYIPGLLTFREGPVLVEAFSRLEHEPDAFVFDGMGRIHPRRIGIASHMGLWLGKPTIGCGKTHFIGTYAEPGNERGAWSDLMDNGERLGVVLRTRANVKPVYISPGHLTDIPSAVELALRCVTRYRLPEPIRAAHHAAGESTDL
ncbi:MAG: deoxyribonuclease V [Anaerolineae bacterium]|nr:deoxyribonuclease V [Anaerolineae bacterium]